MCCIFGASQTARTSAVIPGLLNICAETVCQCAHALLLVNEEGFKERGWHAVCYTYGAVTTVTAARPSACSRAVPTTQHVFVSSCTSCWRNSLLPSFLYYTSNSD